MAEGNPAEGDTYKEAVRKKIRGMTPEDKVRQAMEHVDGASAQNLLDLVKMTGEKTPDDVFDALRDSDTGTSEKQPPDR